MPTVFQSTATLDGSLTLQFNSKMDIDKLQFSSKMIRYGYIETDD